MKILFLHPNFPGQFKHTSRHLVENSNEVYFLCQTHYGRKIEGIKLLTLKGKASHEELNSKNLNLVERTKFLSEQYRSGLLKLKSEGWKPDVVISHSGWGCGLYVKELWPDSTFLTYLEWWFDPTSDFFWYDTKNRELNLNENSIKKNWDRNRFLALELASSDQIIAPTLWQRAQLPKILRNSCKVIFDGIDLNHYCVNLQSRSSSPLLTYGTRGMDPFRGFPQFIRALPKILSKNKNIKVEIAGNDSVFYGSQPSEFKNWKQWAIQYLSDNNISDRISWKGFMTPEKYLHWLQSSWCHVYLTHPFIASWSMVEALCCGSHLITSNVATTKEICENLEGVSLVDHRDENEIVHAISRFFEKGSRITYYDRKKSLSQYSRTYTLEKWVEIIAEAHTRR